MISIVKLSVITAIVMSGFHATGQTNALHIGDNLSAEALRKIKQIVSPAFSDTNADIRLYVLDFWSTGCSSCMESFPKMEALQYTFGKDIKIIAINPWQDDQKVADYMAKSRHYRMTTLPASNGDTLWRDYFPTRTVPHHVWLDHAGKVLAITGGYNTTYGHIKTYLGGSLPRMLLKPKADQYDLRTHSLIQLWGAEAFPNGDDHVRIRPFYEGEGGNSYGYQQFDVVDSANRTIRYSFVNTTFYDLYRCAWIMLPEAPLLVPKSRWTRPYHIADQRLHFQLSVPEYYLQPMDHDLLDEWSLRSKFCVEVVLPLERAHEASSLLFAALNRYFSETLGIAAGIQVMDRPCLVVKATSSANLHTRHGDQAEHQGYDEGSQIRTYINTPFQTIFRQEVQTAFFAGSQTSGFHFKPVLLLDETGIKGPVDIQTHHQLPDTPDPLLRLNGRLQGTGLVAEWAVRPVSMLVIADQGASVD